MQVRGMEPCRARIALYNWVVIAKVVMLLLAGDQTFQQLRAHAVMQGGCKTRFENMNYALYIHLIVVRAPWAR
jgi:hypothetical protein